MQTMLSSYDYEEIYSIKKLMSIESQDDHSFEFLDSGNQERNYDTALSNRANETQPDQGCISDIQHPADLKLKYVIYLVNTARIEKFGRKMR